MRQCHEHKAPPYISGKEGERLEPLVRPHRPTVIFITVEAGRFQVNHEERG